jgi:ferric-dicitrate binding protein FerR (iron transport regulator)
MNKKRNIDWGKMARYLDHEMDAEEQMDFEITARSDQEYEKILDSVRETWNATKTRQNMIEVNTDSAWEKLKTRIETQEKLSGPAKKISEHADRNIIFFALRIAAVLVVTAGLSLVIYRSFIYPNFISQRQLVIKAEPDRMVQTTLPDGSVIHIKANSEINYHKGKRGTRELSLKGEAFFEISPDPDRPFIISTGPALVKVYGTSFSVESQKNGQTVNVYVESGLVSLARSARENQYITIEPGYMGTLTDKGIEKKLNSNDNWLAWKTGKLEFRMKSLDSVIADLNHTYGTDITLESQVIADCHFTGTFLNHQPVDTVLEVLKTAFNLDITRTGSGTILSGTGCN